MPYTLTPAAPWDVDVDDVDYLKNRPEAGEGTEVERSGADAEEVSLNAAEFHQNGAKHLAPGCQFDIEEFLNGVVPDDVITDRTDIVRATGNADELIPTLVLAEFLEAAV